MRYLNQTQYLNQHFHSLKVISESRREQVGKRLRTIVECECICGKIITTQLHRVLSGHTKACGCMKIPKRTHFKTNHPLYKVWDAIRYRCNSPKSSVYKNYGGRGIKVCKSWQESFELFYDWAINAGWQKGLQIDRINNDGNYSPNNCRIVTAKVNCRNRRSTVFVFIKGEKMKLAEAGERGLVNKNKYYKNMEYRNSLLMGDLSA